MAMPTLKDAAYACDEVPFVRAWLGSRGPRGGATVAFRLSSATCCSRTLGVVEVAVRRRYAGRGDAAE
eukprot:7898470-Pyramimonas_sp.AAC.1